MRKKRTEKVETIDPEKYYHLEQAMPFLPFKARHWVVHKYIETGVLRALRTGKGLGRRYKIKGSNLKTFIERYEAGQIERNKYAKIRSPRDNKT